MLFSPVLRVTFPDVPSASPDITVTSAGSLGPRAGHLHCPWALLVLWAEIRAGSLPGHPLSTSEQHGSMFPSVVHVDLETLSVTSQTK